MKQKRVLYITSIDIYDKFGNGGVKASQKNYGLIENYFGKENCYLCTFPEKRHVKPPKDAIIFNRTQSPLEQLVAALFKCKIYFPWDERDIINFINSQNIDLLFIDGSVLGRLAKVTGKYGYKTIVFYHNIESDYAWNKVKNEGYHFLPSYWASKYNDKYGIKADKIICLTDRDSARLENLYGRKADFILPITFTDSFDDNKVNCNYKREILFLGSLFAPNQLSVEWFMKKVMPKLDNIHLNIVGKGFETKKEEYEHLYKNVKVIGSVKELDNSYYSHCAVVLPIKYGAGMKVKTAEAMMYGRRIFASDEALEGYDVEGVSGITRCNTPEEYIETINEYFEKGQFKAYEEDVRNCFLKKYETEVVSNKFYVFLDGML